MTFDKELGVGLGLLILASTVAGAVGGAVRLIPDRVASGGDAGDALGAGTLPSWSWW